MKNTLKKAIRLMDNCEDRIQEADPHKAFTIFNQIRGLISNEKLGIDSLKIRRQEIDNLMTGTIIAIDNNFEGREDMREQLNEVRNRILHLWFYSNSTGYYEDQKKLLTL